MRRSTPNCTFVAEEQRKLLAALASADTVLIARTLEPFVSEERARRLRSVIDARLDCVTIVMDAPHDPHNGGAVLRSCDAFGLQRMHVVERRERFLASRTVARGSERWIDVRAYKTTEGALAALQASKHTLIATHPRGELGPEALASIPRPALVLGNERVGIAAELASACERSVHIPMRGFAESLNVSVTGAILMSYAVQGRSGDLSEDERNRLYARALVLTVPHAPEILLAKGIDVRAAVAG